MLAALRKNPENVAVSLLLLAVTLIFAWRAHHGIWFSGFGDETGHILGAKSIAAGYVLYRDFVDEHGPIIYALPQLYGYLFGWSQPNYVRTIPIAITILTTISIAASPSLRGWWERAAAAAAFVGLIATVWLVQAIFMVNYQPIAGLMMLIGIAQFTIPAWLDTPISNVSLLLSGFCFAVVCFVAFTYGPAAVLFAASGAWACLRRKNYKKIVAVSAGVFAGLAVSVGWMLTFADFRGYVGYHFIAALFYYEPYLNTGHIAALAALWPNSGEANLVQDMALVAGVVAFALLLMTDRWKAPNQRRNFLPILLGIPALILTNPRGSPIFQNGAFVVVAFGIAAIALARAPRLFPDPPRWIRAASTLLASAVILCAEAEARKALSTPHGYTREQMAEAEDGSLLPWQNGWQEKFRHVVEPTETILALPFFPNFYMFADRLPMRGYFLYLPWDADFGKHPALGLHHDLCRDLAQNPPPLILYNAWVVWSRYDPKTYMPCVPNLLASNYQLMPGTKDIYVRNDRASRLSAP